MSTRLPPPVLSTDAIVKRGTLAALVGLIAAQVLTALVAALIAVAFFYVLLTIRNAAG